MNILVVDYQRTQREQLVDTLAGMGYDPGDIFEAGDGAAALDTLAEQEGQVDLVLTEWIMPKMNGLELLRRMKSDPVLAKIPVIFVTFVAQRDRVLEALREGARAVLVRPFKAEALCEKIEEVRLAGEAQASAASEEASPGVVPSLRRALARATKQDDANVPFLEQLPPALRQALLSGGKKSAFPKERLMVRFNDVVDSLHVIESGEVEILAAAGGKALEVRRPGETYGESSFLSGDSAALIARARTLVNVVSLDHATFESLLNEHPELAVYLTRLLSRQSERENARLWSKLADGLSGHLGMMSMGDLVQTIHGGLKTGVLRLTWTGESGEIYFEEGEIKSARCEGVSGESAFYRLLERIEGSFVFQAGKRQASAEAMPATMYLLMEGMRRLDEVRKQGGAPQCPSAGR